MNLQMDRFMNDSGLACNMCSYFCVCFENFGVISVFSCGFLRI